MAHTTETKLSVRYSETDMMGIVYHSRYYPWFEVARTDFIKAAGITYAQMEKDGIMMPLTETWARYHHGLTYGDEVAVTCTLTKLTVARCEFKYKVYKLPERKLMTEGKTGHGFVGKDFKPMNLKKLYPDMWKLMSDLLTEE